VRREGFVLFRLSCTGVNNNFILFGVDLDAPLCQIEFARLTVAYHPGVVLTILKGLQRPNTTDDEHRGGRQPRAVGDIIGRALSPMQVTLQTCLKDCREQGCVCVKFWCGSVRLGTENLPESMGFSGLGTNKRNRPSRTRQAVKSSSPILCH
jgi:hypothetical protein